MAAMNFTSIITLPARLGYEAARRTLDLAVGAGRMVGLFGDDDSKAPAEAPQATPRRKPEPAVRSEQARPQRAKPARARSARTKPSTSARSGARGAATPRKRASGSTPAKAAKPAAAAEPRSPAPPGVPAEPSPVELADTGTGRQPAPLGSRVPGAVEAEEVALIRRVETEVLRDTDAPIAVDVNPIGGVVRLSGRATGVDQVRELQRRALTVPGVKRVENELQVPDTPAPGPFNAERHDADAEPLPSELADRGEGRQPAPLGASDDAPGGGGDPRTTIP